MNEFQHFIYCCSISRLIICFQGFKESKLSLVKACKFILIFGYLNFLFGFYVYCFRLFSLKKCVTFVIPTFSLSLVILI